MSNTNDFIAFAIGAGANVETPAAFAADSVVAQGFQAGTASSRKMNTVWRQSSSIAAMIAQFTADYGVSNVQDNGNIVQLETQFQQALAMFGNVVHYGVDTSSTPNHVTLLTVTPVMPTIVAGTRIDVKVAGQIYAAATITLPGALGTYNIKRADGLDPSPGAALAGGIMPLVYDGTNFQISGQLWSLASTPANTFYVNGTTGNDSNAGTLAAPFKTLQGCVNVVSKYQSSGGVTINVAAGTYIGFSVTPSFISQWRFVGSGIGSCFIDSTSLASNTGRGLVSYGGSVNIDIQGFTCSSYYEGFAANTQSYLSVHDCKFNMTASTSPCLASYNAAYMFLYGTITYAGSNSGAPLIGCQNNGVVAIGYYDLTQTVPCVFVASGAVTFNAFVATSSGSQAFFYGSGGIVSFSGATPTGAKYGASLNGVISTQGSGPSWLPGSAAGSTVLGGQYA